jgi:hypothetical protein
MKKEKNIALSQQSLFGYASSSSKNNSSPPIKEKKKNYPQKAFQPLSLMDGYEDSNSATAELLIVVRRLFWQIKNQPMSHERLHQLLFLCEQEIKAKTNSSPQILLQNMLLNFLHSKKFS